jgi:thioredoxin reductase (NADPH)
MPPAPIVPIIGGGPAGMSCALWLHNYGFHPVIVERDAELGGMARRSPYPDEWLLGQLDGSAREHAAKFAGHMRKLAIETWLDAWPQRLSRASDGGFRLEVVRSDKGEGQSLSSTAVVIAAGTRFRGEDWLERVSHARPFATADRIHLGPAAIAEVGLDAGEDVAVIGGGDNAFDISRRLAEKGVRVTLVMRGQAPRAQPLLVERLRGYQDSGMAKVLAGRAVAALEDAGAKVRVRLDDGGEIVVDRIALLFGYQPNSDEPWLTELAPATDAHGYIVVDGNMETSRRGLFAVGDISNPVHPCIATAIAAGTMAARAIQQRLARNNTLAPPSS